MAHLECGSSISRAQSGEFGLWVGFSLVAEKVEINFWRKMREQCLEKCCIFWFMGTEKTEESLVLWRVLTFQLISNNASYFLKF